LDVDLTTKVTKVSQQHTGARYQIDFAGTTQENATSGYKRGVRREEVQIQLDAAQTLPALPDDVDFGEEGEALLLPLLKGQVIQVSKKHPTQNDWAYGNILYDPLIHDALDKSDGADESSTPGLNTMLAKALHDRPTSGWFPTTVTDHADVDVMHKLLGSLGGEGVATLKPPATWEMDSSQTTKVAEGRIIVPSGTQEYQDVVNYFLVAMYGQRDNVKVTQVERIQNLALWQTFAVKKQTVKARDTKMPQHRVNNDNVEDLDRQLFHGTTEEVIPKIEMQGFNRAFAGRNAVAYGKGVYFARDAAYSSHQTYSTPDSKGIQRMFLCRVVVGDWCRGTNGQLTPDPKPHSQLELFDSTVDNVRNPSIFVVYHDSQAYPEYLISFTRRA
jgi:hypothetical protein